MKHLVFLIFLSFLFSTSTAQEVIEVPSFDTAGTTLPLSTNETQLLTYLQENPEDESAIFALGTVQFLQAIENLGQAWYRYGLNSDFASDLGIPFLRLSVAENPPPERVRYSDIKAVFRQMIRDLNQAEQTLAQINQADVAFLFHFNKIYFDANQNGLKDEQEDLWSIYQNFNRMAATFGQQSEVEIPPDIVLRFDKGDAHWLRGYAHLLMAMLEAILAYDHKLLFESTAQLFFPRPATPHSILENNGVVIDDSFWSLDENIMDAIAFVHILLRIPLSKPRRMKSALKHAEAVNVQARQMWEYILAEEDNNLEWIPNPNQQSVIPVNVDKEMIEAWLGFVDEMDSVWAGEKLIPHWRLSEDQGINLRKVFLKPRTFDLILWIQGSAATPYIEQGELVDEDIFDQLVNVFGGNFVGFALWFN